MSRRFLAVLTALAILTAAAGSTAALANRRSTQAPTKQITIYLIAGITTDAFYITMKKGALAAAAKLGVKLVFQGAPVWSAPKQIPFLDAAIARKPDAILIAPTDTRALVAPIKRAIAAGIPVATVDTAISAPIAFTSVSTDNLAGGRAAADALAKLSGMKGKVAGINTIPGITTTDQRQQGFEQKLKTYPGIQNLGTQFSNDDQTKASQETAALLTAHPDLKGIFAMNVVTGNGVSAAIKNAGKAGKVKVVEFDAGSDQVAALKAGTVDALIAQDPFGIGSLGVQLAVKYVKGQKAGILKHYGTGSAIVTRANVNSPAIKKFLYTK